MDKYFIFNEETNNWNHKSPIKLLINPIFRTLQFWTNKPFVIATEVEFINKVPRFIKYKFTRVRYYKSIQDYHNKKE